MTEVLPEFGISCDADFHQRSLLPKRMQIVFARVSADSTLDRLGKAVECLGVGDSWMGGAAFAMPLNDSISNFVPCRQERCVPFLRMATDPAVRRIP